MIFPSRKKETPAPEPTEPQDQNADDTSSMDNSTLDQAEETDDQAVASSLEADLLKMRETALRTAAEYDNYRKRVAKEKEDIIRYANTRLLEELLPVIDNFDMGMMAAQNDKSSMIYIGMSMVQKQLEDFLANQGITPIDTSTLFDHNLHEAVSTEIVDENTPEDSILRVVRKGYMIKGKLLRPATVVVARHATEEDAPTEA